MKCSERKDTKVTETRSPDAIIAFYRMYARRICSVDEYSSHVGNLLYLTIH